jgi:hypothetical protein
MASLRVLVEEGILNRGGLIVRGTASGSGLLQTYSRELLVFHNSGRTLGSYRCGVHEFFDDGQPRATGSSSAPTRAPGSLGKNLSVSHQDLVHAMPKPKCGWLSLS